MERAVQRPQDIGGEDHGLVNPDPNEPVFHAEWERRAFGLSFCTRLGSHVTLDRFRRYQAALSPERYIGSSYSERWLHAVERVMLDEGVLTETDLESLRPDGRPAPAPWLAASELAVTAVELVESGRNRLVEATRDPVFSVADEVRVLDIPLEVYDRLPGYLRRRVGVIDAHYGSFGTPDELVTGEWEVSGAHLYRVRFTATELWGVDAESPGDELCVDLFEQHLELQ